MPLNSLFTPIVIMQITTAFLARLYINLVIGIFFIEYILSDECVSTKLGVTVNHVLVSLASPFYDLALHLSVLSTT